MQSAVPHVLGPSSARTTRPRRDGGRWAPGPPGWRRAWTSSTARRARALDDWRTSLDAAVALEPDHMSAYALVVEEGTRLAAQVRRGEVAMPEGDDEADKYELADAVLAAAGYDWYEVSNWSRDAAGRCRHNEGYWRGDAWWGVGPGAHSHVGGVRWWNVKHPARTPPGCARAPRPAQVARPSPTSSATTRRCCSGCGCATACRSTRSTPGGAGGGGRSCGRRALEGRPRR